MSEVINYKSKRKPRGYKKRTLEQRELDLLFCSNLFLRGYSYRDIAAQLNKELSRRGCDYTITFQMVYYDLQQCLIEWKRERFDNIDDYVTQELRKLDKLEIEIWEAWENSKKKIIRKSSQNEDEETANETSAGNPKFLDLVLNVQQRRAKLLGYDAPIKINGLGKSGQSEVEKYDLEAIPEDLLYAVVDKLQESKFIETIEEKENPNHGTESSNTEKEN